MTWRSRPLVPGDRRHGSYAGYQAGCVRWQMCEASPTCVDAERAYQLWRNRQMAAGRPLKVPSTGTRRRIEALYAQGHTGAWIAEQVGCSYATLACSYPTVRTWVAVAVRELYEQYQHQEGPSEKTRSHAKAFGWVPPWRWDGLNMDNPDVEPHPEVSDAIDMVAIERRLEGKPERLTKTELTLACHLAHERKIPHANKVLGISGSTFASHLTKERPHEDVDRGSEPHRLPPGDAGDGGEVRQDPQELHGAGGGRVAAAS